MYCVLPANSVRMPYRAVSERGAETADDCDDYCRGYRAAGDGRQCGWHADGAWRHAIRRAGFSLVLGATRKAGCATALDGRRAARDYRWSDRPSRRQLADPALPALHARTLRGQCLARHIRVGIHRGTLPRDGHRHQRGAGTPECPPPSDGLAAGGRDRSTAASAGPAPLRCGHPADSALARSAARRGIACPRAVSDRALGISWISNLQHGGVERGVALGFRAGDAAGTGAAGAAGGTAGRTRTPLLPAVDSTGFRQCQGRRVFRLRAICHYGPGRDAATMWPCRTRRSSPARPKVRVPRSPPYRQATFGR